MNRRLRRAAKARSRARPRLAVHQVATALALLAKGYRPGVQGPRWTSMHKRGKFSKKIYTLHLRLARATNVYDRAQAALATHATLEELSDAKTTTW